MIAQVSAPPTEGISSSVFQPLVFIALVYIVLSIVGQALAGRDNPRGKVLLDWSFGVLVVAGLYTVVLLFIALAQEFDLVVDLLKILAVLLVFFGVLLVGLLGIFDFGVGSIARMRSRGEPTPTPATEADENTA